MAQSEGWEPREPSEQTTRPALMAQAGPSSPGTHAVLPLSQPQVGLQKQSTACDCGRSRGVLPKLSLLPALWPAGKKLSSLAPSAFSMWAAHPGGTLGSVRGLRTALCLAKKPKPSLPLRHMAPSLS